MWINTGLWTTLSTTDLNDSFNLLLSYIHLHFDVNTEICLLLSLTCFDLLVSSFKICQSCFPFPVLDYALSIFSLSLSCLNALPSISDFKRKWLLFPFFFLMDD